MTLTIALSCAAALLAIAAVAIVISRSVLANSLVYGLCGAAALISLYGALKQLLGASPPENSGTAARNSMGRCAFPSRCALCFLSRRCRSRRRRGESVRDRLRKPRGGAVAGSAVLSGVPRRHDSRRDRGRRFHISFFLGIHVAHVLGAGHVASPRARQCLRRLRLSGHGELRHAGAAAGIWAAGRTRRTLHVRPDSRRAPDCRAGGPRAHPRPPRRRLEGRVGAASRLAATGPSGGTQPRFRVDERRYDQGRGLRLRADHFRSGRRTGNGGGA